MNRRSLRIFIYSIPVIVIGFVSIGLWLTSAKTVIANHNPEPGDYTVGVYFKTVKRNVHIGKTGPCTGYEVIHGWDGKAHLATFTQNATSNAEEIEREVNHELRRQGVREFRIRVQLSQ